MINVYRKNAQIDSQSLDGIQWVLCLQFIILVYTKLATSGDLVTFWSAFLQCINI